MTPQRLDDCFVVYLYLFAFVVGTGALADGWLTLTGQKMVTDYLRDFGYVHLWFQPVSAVAVAFFAVLFVIAFIFHLWWKP